MGWVFDWHGQDGRATGPLDVDCTVTQTNILENVPPTMTCTHGGEPAVAYGFIYKQGAKAGSVGAGEVAPTIKTDQPPAAAYANGTETTARADGSPMLDRGQNVVIEELNQP